MFSFRDTLPDRLHDPLQLLDRRENPALNQLQFWHNRSLEFLERDFISVDMADSVFCFWMLPTEVVFAHYGMEEDGEMASKPSAGGEEVGHSLVERLRVFEQLLCPDLNGAKPTGVVIEFGVGRL